MSLAFLVELASVFAAIRIGYLYDFGMIEDKLLYVLESIRDIVPRRVKMRLLFSFSVVIGHSQEILLMIMIQFFMSDAYVLYFWLS